MKELIRAYKIVGYGMSIKKQLAFAVGFAILGLIFEIITRGGNIIGAFYIILSGMFIYQLIISVDVSTLVQSSPFKKRIQCTYPVLATTPFIYVTLAVLSVVHWIFAKTGGPETAAQQGQMMFVLGTLLFIVMVYFGCTYKFFVVSMILMCVGISFSMGFLFHLAEIINMSFGVSVIYAFAMTTLGSLLAYVLSNALYKYPLDKLAFRGMLKMN